MSANKTNPREKVCLSDYLNEFKMLMRRELTANKHKGDFLTWEPNAYQLISEASYHMAKLNKAILEVERAQINDARIEVTEYAADVANIMMKTVQVLGDGFDKMRGLEKTKSNESTNCEDQALTKVREKLAEIVPLIDGFSDEDWNSWLNALPKEEFLALFTIDRKYFKEFAEGKYAQESVAA